MIEKISIAYFVTSVKILSLAIFCLDIENTVSFGAFIARRASEMNFTVVNVKVFCIATAIFMNTSGIFRHPGWLVVTIAKLAKCESVICLCYRHQ